jgi:superfamily II DNA or RNA helicase
MTGPTSFDPEAVLVPTSQPDGDDAHQLLIDVVRLHDDSSEPKSQLEVAAEETRAMQVAAAHAKAGGKVLSFFRMRPYQEETIEAVERHWGSGIRSTLVVLPTGTGKLIVAAEIIRRRQATAGGQAIFLAHRLDLLDQSLDKIRVIAPNLTGGIVQGKTNELRRDITVASIQTLAGGNGLRLEQLLNAGRYTTIIHDEAHHAASPSHQRVLSALMEANPDARLVGFTATPARTDATTLDSVFSNVAYSRSIIEMVDEGWLVRPRGVLITLDVDLDDADSRNGDLVESQLSRLMNQPAVNRAVVEAYQRFGEHRRMIGFSVDVDHAKNLAEAFREAGIDADFIAGYMKKDERETLKRRFCDRELRLLFSCEILVEGFDDPGIEGVLFARPTQSALWYSQAAGRSLRVFPGKTDSLILDCVGNSTRHSLIQLATVFGLEPISPPEPKEETDEEEGQLDLFVGESAPEILSVTVHGREIILTPSRTLPSQLEVRFHWNETPLGWVLQVPRIGYYLVNYYMPEHDRSRAWVRFYDSRPHRRGSPPVDIIPPSHPIPFEMAYGLVEAEAERILRALADGRVRSPDQLPDEDLPQYLGLDDGLSEDPQRVRQIMLKDGQWRERPTSQKQRETLIKMGVKDDQVPATAGLSSDLIGLLSVERDQRYRVPATPRQLAYLRINQIAHHPDITKGGAAQLIYRHRADGAAATATPDE